ncbi:MAG: type IV pilin N-terminal domain-containing protein [Methanosarcinaceae archaeon]|nr:type IV pilin N-terminal domain-containing protein [Methanosarcinaceae archaeon]
MPPSLMFRSDKALSPMIGTVIALMIVVILAAIIGATVFGGSSPTKSGPMANLEISEIDTHTLKLEHLGGDPIDFSKNLKIHFYHKGTDYELSYPDRIELLQTGDSNPSASRTSQNSNPETGPSSQS